MAGLKIFRKRHQLRAFNSPGGDDSLGRYTDSGIQVTSEIESMRLANINHSSAGSPGKGSVRNSSSSKHYEKYVVNVTSTPFASRPPMTPKASNLSTQQRMHKATMEANRAAFGYTKVASLFFVSLLVTWVSTASLCNEPFAFFYISAFRFIPSLYLYCSYPPPSIVSTPLSTLKPHRSPWRMPRVLFYHLWAFGMPSSTFQPLERRAEK